jgi:penicillin-binding protein 2
MISPFAAGTGRNGGDRAGETSGRIRLLSILTVVLFVSYSAYLFFLQVVRGSEYRDRATNIARQVSIIPAQRGEIYDREYAVPLVLNTDSFAVDLVPAAVPANRRDELFARLSETLGISIDEIRRKVPVSYYHLYQPIEILGSVPYSTISAIAERKTANPSTDDYPGISWRSKPVRNYLETGSLAHVIGYVGDLTKDELKLYYNQGYKSGDVIGKSGIEKQYDKNLRGQEGREYRTVDVKGRSVAAETQSIDPRSWARTSF